MIVCHKRTSCLDVVGWQHYAAVEREEVYGRKEWF